MLWEYWTVENSGGFHNPGLARESLTGFGHNALLGVADKVISAVNSGAIKHFFLVENFNVGPTTRVDADMKAVLG